MEIQLKNFSNTTLDLVDVNIKFALENGAWLNATEVSKTFGKDLSNYWKSQDTQEYMKSVCNFNSVKSTELKQAIQGKYGGTYIHPDLIIHFARWISSDFAVACDRWIKNEIRLESKKNEMLILEEAQQQIAQIEADANKVRLHDDGTTSITGLIQHYGFQESYDYIKDALVWKEVMTVDIKITTRPTMNDDYMGLVYKSKTFKKDGVKATRDYTYIPDAVRAIINQYNKVGSPCVNQDFKTKMRRQLEEYLSDK